MTTTITASTNNCLRNIFVKDVTVLKRLANDSKRNLHVPSLR